MLFKTVNINAAVVGRSSGYERNDNCIEIRREQIMH